jgi:hypothetical protein
MREQLGKHSRAAWVAMLPLAVTLAACDNPVYYPQGRPLQAMAPTPAPGMMANDNALMSDTDLFVVPVRQPTAQEAQALVDEQTKLGLPMPVPWVAVRDIDIEINWSLKNLEDKEVLTRVTVNGGNEFGDYDKTLYADPTAPPEDQMAPPDLMGGGVLVPLGAGATRSGVFREDQLREAALDLEAITRFPSPTDAFHTPFIVLVRQSSASAIGLEGIPAGDVTPAMVRMSILLESNGKTTLDYSVRVREKGTPRDKLSTEGAPDLYVSTAAVLAAPVKPVAPMLN